MSTNAPVKGKARSRPATGSICESFRAQAAELLRELGDGGLTYSQMVKLSGGCVSKAPLNQLVLGKPVGPRVVVEALRIAMLAETAGHPRIRIGENGPLLWDGSDWVPARRLPGGEWIAWEAPSVES